MLAWHRLLWFIIIFVNFCFHVSRPTVLWNILGLKNRLRDYCPVAWLFFQKEVYWYCPLPFIKSLNKKSIRSNCFCSQMMFVIERILHLWGPPISFFVWKKGYSLTGCKHAKVSNVWWLKNEEVSFLVFFSLSLNNKLDNNSKNNKTNINIVGF